MAEKRLADRVVGEKYVSDETRLITPTELDIFCNITGMRGAAFLSDEAAKAFGMKSRLLPGAMSLAILFSDRVLVTYLWTLKNQDGVTVAQGENT